MVIPSCSNLCDTLRPDDQLYPFLILFFSFQFFPKFLSKVRGTNRSGRIAGARLMHAVCDLDVFCRQQAVLLGCVPPLVTMMDKEDILEQETAAAALVAMAKDKVVKVDCLLILS